VHTLPFWDELVAERAPAYPDVAWGQEHIDALCAKLFSILDGSTSSSGPLVRGHLVGFGCGGGWEHRIAPAANLNPEREFPSISSLSRVCSGHRRAGDRQPCRRDLDWAMMLEHLGMGRLLWVS